MTRALVFKLLRDVRLPLCVVAVLVIAFQCLWVKIAQRAATQLSPFFTSLAARAGVKPEQIEEQIFSGPGKVMQTLAGGENIQFDRAMDMLTIGYVHPLMLIVFCVWGVGRASSAIAGELDRGTMELLLAQPMPRWRVIVAHLIVDAIVIPLVAASLWLGTTLGLYLVGPFQAQAAEAQKAFGSFGWKVVVDPKLLATDAWAFGPALFNVGALIFAVSGLTMALSAGGRFRNRVLGWAILVVLVQFIANVVGQFWDTLAVIRPFTLFYYYQPQQVILHHKWTVDLLAGAGKAPVPVNVVAVLFGVGLIGYLIAMATFTRRDLPAPL